MKKLEQLAEPGSPDELLAQKMSRRELPEHIAIIMDGNGRWAQSRGRSRIEGHRAGVDSVRDTIEASAQLGLDVLTLYAFSVENWKRPRHEVWALMNLLKEYLLKELASLVKNDIRLKILGRWRELDPSVVALIERAERETEDCGGLQLNIALNYSGRSEIVDACRQIVSDWAQGKGTDIDEETLGRYLYTAGLPDPDLLIRTSGEMRVSNFLLWQISYTEIFVTDTLWPDFRRGHLFEAILDYQNRARRFGGLSKNADRDLQDKQSG
jgi:undecaprenyl diphosphate synthase